MVLISEKQTETGQRKQLMIRQCFDENNKQAETRKNQKGTYASLNYGYTLMLSDFRSFQT